MGCQLQFVSKKAQLSHLPRVKRSHLCLSDRRKCQIIEKYIAWFGERCLRFTRWERFGLINLSFDVRSLKGKGYSVSTILSIFTNQVFVWWCAGWIPSKTPVWSSSAIFGMAATFAFRITKNKNYWTITPATYWTVSCGCRRLTGSIRSGTPSFALRITGITWNELPNLGKWRDKSNVA